VVDASEHRGNSDSGFVFVDQCLDAGDVFGVRVDGEEHEVTISLHDVGKDALVRSFGGMEMLQLD
jgi:hypothetical protein